MCNTIDYSTILSVKVMRDGDGDGRCQEEDGKWVPCPPGVSDGSVVDRLGRSIGKIPLGQTIAESRHSSKPPPPVIQQRDNAITSVNMSRRERIREYLKERRAKAAEKAQKIQERTADAITERMRQFADDPFVFQHNEGDTETFTSLTDFLPDQKRDAEWLQREAEKRFPNDPAGRDRFLQQKKNLPMDRRKRALKAFLSGLFNSQGDDPGITVIGKDGKKYKLKWRDQNLKVAYLEVDSDEIQPIAGIVLDLVDPDQPESAQKEGRAGWFGQFTYGVKPEGDLYFKLANVLPAAQGEGFGSSVDAILTNLFKNKTDSITLNAFSNSKQGMKGATHWFKNGWNWKNQESKDKHLAYVRRMMEEKEDAIGEELLQWMRMLIDEAESEPLGPNQEVLPGDLLEWSGAEKWFADQQQGFYARKYV